MLKPIDRHHPEVAVGGYSAVDSTVDFYLRIRTLLQPDQVVLDVGAGRASWLEDMSLPSTTRSLLDLRGDGRRLWGCDVDSVVLTNLLLDEAKVLKTSESELPYETGSVDVIISDWTFEHLENPKFTGREMARVVKPGGWFCARTPNKNGYISFANRLIPDRLHSSILRRGQPYRKEEDVFPTHYRANTAGAVRAAFGEDFDLTIYTLNPEPAYFGESRLGWGVLKMVERALPRRFGAVLVIFGKRKPYITPPSDR